MLCGERRDKITLTTLARPQRLRIRDQPMTYRRNTVAKDCERVVRPVGRRRQPRASEFRHPPHAHHPDRSFLLKPQGLRPHRQPSGNASSYSVCMRSNSRRSFAEGVAPVIAMRKLRAATTGHQRRSEKTTTAICAFAVLLGGRVSKNRDLCLVGVETKEGTEPSHAAQKQRASEHNSLTLLCF